jgi:hypothetical protein
MAAKPEIVGRRLVTLAFVLVFSATSLLRAATETLTADQTQIVNIVSTIFTAARADDIAKFDSVIASEERRMNQRRTAIAWISKWPPRSSDATPINSRAGNSLVVK